MKKTVKVGIGIAIVIAVGIAISSFTNIDDLISSQVRTTTSEIQLESLDNPFSIYILNTKCELYEGYMVTSRGGQIINPKRFDGITSFADLGELPVEQYQKLYAKEKQRNDEIRQKINDQKYDYHIQNGIQWHDIPGRTQYTAEDEKNLQDIEMRGMLELMDANPNLLDELREIWGVDKGVIVTKQLARDEPDCVRRLMTSPHSYQFIFE